MTDLEQEYVVISAGLEKLDVGTRYLAFLDEIHNLIGRDPDHVFDSELFNVTYGTLAKYGYQLKTGYDIKESGVDQLQKDYDAEMAKFSALVGNSDTLTLLIDILEDGISAYTTAFKT